MRSPLLLLLAGTVAAFLVAGAVLVWAMPERTPDTAAPGEVVVGESPGASPAPPSDEDVVPPPPPITDHDGDGTPDAEDPDHSGASDEPSSSPSATPSQAPAPTCGDGSGDDDDDDCDDDGDYEGGDDDD